MKTTASANPFMHGSSIGLGHWPFTSVRRVRFPYRVPSLGAKVFMDAHEPVTLEEGDRYPLAPPERSS